MLVVFEVDKGAYFVLVLFFFLNNMLVEEVFGVVQCFFLLTSPGIVVSVEF